MLRLLEPLSVQQISEVISQVTGPAFLLAAEAQLLAVLVARLDRIIDHKREIESMSDDEAGPQMKAALAALKQRGALMHRAIYWGVGSCVVTSLLVMVGFAAAYLRVRHEYGASLLFVVAMALFTAALIAFAREIKLGYAEIDADVMLPLRRGDGSGPRV